MRTREVVLENQLEEIESEIDEIAGRMADLDSDTDLYQELSQRGNRLDTHRRAIEWALDEWDVDTVTFRALTIGDDARLQDETDNEGERMVWQIALGTEVAPYVADDLEQTVANVADIEAIAYARWAQAAIDDLSAVGNLTTEQSFARSLTAKRSEQQSAATQ